MMYWNMFIDDERSLNDVTWAPWHVIEKYRNEKWIVCRNKMQVIQAIFDHDKNVPNFISFDHDLGENEPTGYDILKWIVNFDMDGIITMPQDLKFYVHSKNMVGKKNIEVYLDNYLDFKKENK